ncbi:hypothetical protein D3H65_05655 [Paraflavitalea soli]|uniref:Uncharacterized protein n=1 Tax=Paraflavitalea soli TaxID=2315862 RepID=A0A3B7MJL6_9BACT|nr:hypothetical protein [Paraflavitalea soli]AXY73493.1 hypothetical protein D3H65_05655 [Paraflavitalea soli]
MTRKNKNKLTKKRIHEEAAFGRTRENMSEFGRAGEANRLVREAFNDVLQPISDRYVSGRLTKRMVRIIHSDPVRARGERIVTPEALPMLEGFNFNRNKLLADTLYAPWHLYLDHAAGLFRIHIPFFNAITMVDTQSGADDYRLIACATAIDFENRDTKTVIQQSQHILTNDTTTRSINFSLHLPPGNTHPVILTLGVEFFGGGIPGAPIASRYINAMAVIKVVTG